LRISGIGQTPVNHQGAQRRTKGDQVKPVSASTILPNFSFVRFPGSNTNWDPDPEHEKKHEVDAAFS
jgi:hypothetical protein